MGTNWNFKNLSNDSAQPPGNFPLARQSSIYSLTFDEFQSTVGGIGKDFGSMNMDELLKNIWSAEENQNHNMAAAAAAASSAQDGILQRQGSLTLPRTLSQKTVDEVWKDVWKDYGTGSGGGGGSGVRNPQRQQTLGEITLEEFLVRAGVVREDATPVAGKAQQQQQQQQQVNGVVAGGGGGVSLFGNNNTGYGIGYQQSNGASVVGLSNGSNSNNGNPIQSGSNMGLNVSNGVVIRSNQVQAQQQQQQVHQPPQIYPKQGNVGYGIPQLAGGIMGIGDQGNNGLIQGVGGGIGMVGGLGGGAMSSPASQVSSDGIGKSNGDTSSVSPVLYPFSGSVRGRRANTAVEKVVERRQRRMIKNRESAARSRARKQAYTTELEAEVAKLKEENQELKRKQEEITEMQKNQVMEMMNMEQGGKKRRLRRTLTGPW
ncbi:ABSCISIC ACID-INSENSITIVE 5-like protein 5 [Linum perenne]